MKLCDACGHWHVDNTLRLNCVQCGKPLSHRTGSTVREPTHRDALRTEGTFRAAPKTPRQASDDR